MHELSLVRSLMAQVSQIVTNHPNRTVREIHVQCGPLSGVEPALMLSAFELIRNDTPWSSATLFVEPIPLLAQCNRCEQTFEPRQFRFVCPKCESVDTQEISGNGVILESITLEDVAPCAK